METFVANNELAIGIFPGKAAFNFETLFVNKPVRFKYFKEFLDFFWGSDVAGIRIDNW